MTRRMPPRRAESRIRLKTRQGRKLRAPQALERRPQETMVCPTGCLALPTLLHDASVEGLKGPDIVRIKLGELVDLLRRDIYRSLQHKPRDSLSTRRSS